MGIELNLNIFETNLINLSIVLSVVFLVIGDAFKSALSERKNGILTALNEANERYEEAQNRLNAAVALLEEAKEKAQAIQKEAPATAQKEKETIQTQYALEETRMTQKFESDSNLAGARLAKTLYNHMVRTSISKARTYLVTHMDQVGQNASLSKVVDLIDSEKEVALA